MSSVSYDVTAADWSFSKTMFGLVWLQTRTGSVPKKGKFHFINLNRNILPIIVETVPDRNPS